MMTAARTFSTATTVGASPFQAAKRITNTAGREAISPRRRHFFALFSPAPSPSPEPSPTTTLSARRILPCPVASVFSLIADVDSYQSFLPNCQKSHVTAWADPVPAGAHEEVGGGVPAGRQRQQQRNGGQRERYPPQPPLPLSPSSLPSPSSQPPSPNTDRRHHLRRTRYPALADLTIGWGPFHESYTSRVYCVPYSVVEALSGRARTAIPAQTLLRYGYGDHLRREEEEERVRQASGQPGQPPAPASDLFASLATRWTVRPVAAGPAAEAARRREETTTYHHAVTALDGRHASSAPAEAEEQWTEASLAVTFQFENPAMGHAVRLMGRHKIDEMVHAFEQRAWRLCGR